jgi:two-component system chemotaxis response regulator CheB
MPRSALQHVEVDFCLPLEALGDKLMELTASAPGEPASPPPPRKSIEVEGRLDLGQKTVPRELAEIAIPSGFACPECQGTLWEIRDAVPAHFRCHTGHVYTEQGLARAQDGAVEEALWAAIRALHEKQMLLQRLAKSADQAQRHGAFNEHVATAEAVARHAETLRKMLVTQGEK